MSVERKPDRLQEPGRTPGSGSRQVILVVDDAPELRELWSRALDNFGYESYTASNGREGLDWLRANSCTLVLCDQVMPEMSGLELLREVRTVRPGVPVVMITGEHDVELAKQALREGAVDFLTKPFRLHELPLAIERTLERLRIQTRAIEEGQARILLEAISSLAVAIDARDPYSASHSRSVSRLCDEMARHLNLPRMEAETLRLSALLHDIGKISWPDSILGKEGSLTESEWAQVRQHPSVGAAIVGQIVELRYVADVLRHHHERPDGRGYPDQLQDRAIPFLSSLIAVADAWDAMTSNRSYRRRLSTEEAIRRMRAGIGTQFQPDAAAALFHVLNVSDA